MPLKPVRGRNNNKPPLDHVRSLELSWHCELSFLIDLIYCGPSDDLITEIFRSRVSSKPNPKCRAGALDFRGCSAPAGRARNVLFRLCEFLKPQPSIDEHKRFSRSVMRGDQ